MVAPRHDPRPNSVLLYELDVFSLPAMAVDKSV